MTLERRASILQHMYLKASCTCPVPAVDSIRAQLFHQESDVHLANLPDPYSIFLRYALDPHT